MKLSIIQCEPVWAQVGDPKNSIVVDLYNSVAKVHFRAVQANVVACPSTDHDPVFADFDRLVTIFTSEYLKSHTTEALARLLQGGLF